MIYPDALPIRFGIYAEGIGAVGERLPDWEKFVQLDAGGKSKSSLEVENILNRGRVVQEEWAQKAFMKAKYEALAADDAKRIASGNVGNNPSNSSQPVKVNPVNANDAEVGSQIVRPTAEVNVLVWWSLGRRIPVRAGKVTVNVRNPTPEDAGLYAMYNQNSSGRPSSMEIQGMIIIPTERMQQQLPSWISNSYSVIRNKFRTWPQGKVAEMSFNLLEGQDSPMEGREDWRYRYGTIIGGALAMNTVLTGVQMDPESVAYGYMANNRDLGELDANMVEAVGVAREKGYRLMVVSDKMERITRDWVALGDLNRLIDPQIVMASDVDEFVNAMRSDRPDQVKGAIELFAEFKDIKRMTLEEALKTPVGKQRLQDIMDQFPQHLSAKMLLAYSEDSVRGKASLSGSVSKIINLMKPFLERYNNAMVEDSVDSKKRKELGDQAIARLKFLRDRMNDGVVGFLGISEDTLEAIVSFLSLSSRTSSTAMKRRGKVEDALLEFNDEYRRLRFIVDEERERRQSEMRNN